MYGEKEKAAKAREYKHMTFQEAARLGREAAPREMWLTHYSPSLIRPEDYLEEIREIFPRIKQPGTAGPWNWALTKSKAGKRFSKQSWKIRKSG